MTPQKRPAFLKSKETRLRDWNLANHLHTRLGTSDPWNQKKLDYEIETRRDKPCPEKPCFSWNQKKLDYEIETSLKSNRYFRTGILETKRNSITRLKRNVVNFCAKPRDCLKPKETRLRDWNLSASAVLTGALSLKPKETRLRDWNIAFASGATIADQSLKPKETRLRDWNQKVLDGFKKVVASAWNQKKLDYEIETLTLQQNQKHLIRFSWNQKKLDYEIETCSAFSFWRPRRSLETIRTLITRLKKNLTSCFSVVPVKNAPSWKKKDVS